MDDLISAFRACYLPESSNLIAVTDTEVLDLSLELSRMEIGTPSSSDAVAQASVVSTTDTPVLMTGTEQHDTTTGTVTNPVI